jgi:chromosome partitioning protein
MRKILVVNPKGGCGKTTIATNIASFYTSHGYPTALFDYDPQGSSMLWLKHRPDKFSKIYGVAAYKNDTNTTRAWQLQVPQQTERVIIDTPAGMKAHELSEHMRGVDTVLIPLLPSIIDIHATANFLHDLVKIAKLQTGSIRIFIVANRVIQRSKTFQELAKFISGLEIPVAGYIRDTVNYVSASNVGLGLHEFPYDKVKSDRKVWMDLIKRIDHQFDSSPTLPHADVPVKSRIIAVSPRFSFE